MRSSGKIRSLDRNFLNVKQVGSQGPWETDRGCVLRVQCSGRHLGGNVLASHPSCGFYRAYESQDEGPGRTTMARERIEQLGEDAPGKFTMDLVHWGLQGTD